MSYQLIIRSRTDPDYRHVIAERDTERELERVEDGVNINLDHVNYYTEVVEAS